MKPLSVLIDIRAYPEGNDRTSLLTSAHEPELLADGWVRFKTRDGEWHRVAPSMVLRITEYREPDKVIEKPIKTVEVPYLVSKRKPKSV